MAKISRNGKMSRLHRKCQKKVEKETKAKKEKKMKCKNLNVKAVKHRVI